MPSTRIYIIGAGFIARAHAAAIAKLPNHEHVTLSVAGRSPKSLQTFAECFPRARVSPDPRAMLAEAAQPDDIVIVATPPASHGELTCAALTSGRHVLCEKPLAMTGDEAAEMLRVARAHDRFLGCCSTRFLDTPPTNEAKRLLCEGALGDLYHVTFVNRRQRCRAGIDAPPIVPWYYHRAQSGGGVLMDMGPYEFTTLNDILRPVRVDVLDAWMADPQAAFDRPPGAVYDVEQHVGAALRYRLPDGRSIPVTYERADCTHGGERAIVELEGTRGAVSWDWLDFQGKGAITFGADDNGRIVERRTVLGWNPKLGYDDKPLYFFHERVQGRSSPAVVDEHAVFNFRCLLAVYDCIRSGQPQSVSLDGICP